MIHILSVYFPDSVPLTANIKAGLDLTSHATNMNKKKLEARNSSTSSINKTGSRFIENSSTELTKLSILVSCELFRNS